MRHAIMEQLGGRPLARAEPGDRSEAARRVLGRVAERLGQEVMKRVGVLWCPLDGHQLAAHNVFVLVRQLDVRTDKKPPLSRRRRAQQDRSLTSQTLRINPHRNHLFGPHLVAHVIGPQMPHIAVSQNFARGPPKLVPQGKLTT